MFRGKVGHLVTLVRSRPLRSIQSRHSRTPNPSVETSTRIVQGMVYKIYIYFEDLKFFRRHRENLGYWSCHKVGYNPFIKRQRTSHS